MNGIELVTSWFTPSVLFCVLNLMIGTIFITSAIKPPQNQQQQHGKNEGGVPRQLGRVPSLLERVKSINLSRYGSDEPDGEHPPQLGRVPSFLERVKSIKLSRNRSDQPEPVEEPPVQRQEPEEHNDESHHVMRTKSAAAEKAKPAAKVLKKSASEKVVASKREEEEEVDRRRPATVRERTAESSGDEAVDEKADDFINKFRQQLKLQRLDSILRYTEMLKRGSAR